MMAEIVEKKGPGDQGTRGPATVMAEILILAPPTTMAMAMTLTTMMMYSVHAYSGLPSETQIALRSEPA